MAEKKETKENNHFMGSLATGYCDQQFNSTIILGKIILLGLGRRKRSWYILCPAGKSEVEEWSDMYTVTSQLMLTVHKEDDGVPVICQVEHPAVTGNLQTQRYLEVQCE